MSAAHASDVLVIGEALVDVFTGPGGAHEAFGGSPANTALALGRLGHRVRLATAIGRDRRGEGLTAWLAASGVTVESTDTARTATAETALAPDGSADYAFDIAWDVDLSGVAPSPLIHTGSIAAVLEPGADAVERYLRDLQSTSTVSIDPNIRPSLVGPGDRVRIERLLALADVIKLSDDDLAWLAPGSSPRAAASRWLEAGAALVVVTRGARGALGFSHSARVACAAHRVEVVDTVAAGDTFTAALLDGLASEGLIGAQRRDALREIGVDALERVLSRAAVASAVTVGRRGANPPTREELAAAGG